MTLPALPIGMVITLVIAMIIDTICATKGEGKKRLIAIIENISLLIATVLIYVSIYIMDLINSKYVWIAFVVGVFYLLIVDIISHKRFIKKVGHILGLVIISLIILFYFCFTRYELQTKFYQPCWAPSGGQIAFFMEKDLYRYHLGFPFSLWSPDDIWKKYYLCTMDYDGGNFKIVKKSEDMGSIMWPSDETIVYNQKIMIDKLHYTKYKGNCYKICPDGTRLEELWQWDEKSEYQGVGWVTPDANYLVLAKSTDTGKRIGIYSRREKKIKKEILFYGTLKGSYKDNTIAIDYNRHLTIINLDTLTTKEVDWKEKETEEKLFVGYDLGALSPDRSMYVGNGPSIWSSKNKKLLAYYHSKDRRSYLFNIFGK